MAALGKRRMSPIEARNVAATVTLTGNGREQGDLGPPRSPPGDHPVDLGNLGIEEPDLAQRLLLGETRAGGRMRGRALSIVRRRAGEHASAESIVE